MFSSSKLFNSLKFKNSLFSFKKFYANRVVSFHYTLKDQNTGDIYDTTDNREPFSFVEGMQQILPELENQLESLNVGDKAEIKLHAKDAYGLYRNDLLTQIPKKNFGFEVNVGDYVTMGNDPLSYRIHAIGEENVTVDLNHPLADKDLVFDVNVIEAREATLEERTPRHVHHAGCGHDHSHSHEHEHSGCCRHDNDGQSASKEGCCREEHHDSGCSHDHKEGESCSPNHRRE